MKKIVMFMLCLWLLQPYITYGNEQVTVYAPSSTINVMDEIISLYNKSGGNVVVSYGSSGALVKQIESGAPASIFIAANKDWMDKLENDGFVLSDTRKVLTGNKLVIVANKNNKVSFTLSKDLDIKKILQNEKIVMGRPESGPAGNYAKQSFIKLNLWDKIQPYLVTSSTVRESLALVSRGEAKLGVVFITDAMQDKNVIVAAEFPKDTHDKIEYPVAVVKEKDNPAVRKFYEFLLSSQSKAIFKKYGFM